MILNKVEITGYKRFKKASVQLDRKLIAFVGPNEAGKSSFFNALLSIENAERYENNHLTREYEFEDKDTIIKIHYLLEKEEKELVSKFNGIGEIRFYCLWKSVEGERFHKIIGDVKRDKSKRNILVGLIEKIIANKDIKKILENLFESEEEDARSGDILLEEVIFSINLTDETLNEEVFEIVEKVELFIASNINSLNENGVFTELLVKTTEFLKLEKEKHPKDKILKHLDTNRPEFILFSNQERFLKGEYTLEELKNPPSALNNLLNLADIDSDELVDIIENKKTGKRLKLQEKSNRKLLNEFNDSWSQSEVYPQFLFDVDGIKIQISYIDSYTEIHERSEGLKQYIALKAFLANTDSKIPPILLIDEAEIHLHYSAQSDLVSEFEKQKIVNSIIYTTHSAGCLPSDLGTGIRVVEPLIENNNDLGISIIKNSIWQNSGGFSPLLLAMGANIIAFTLARKAVIAEGPSETILLPRLIREATSLEYLDFQVAPGIASISKVEAKSFELEAAKVVYLVDGDSGGNENRKKLKKGGIDETRIIQLPSNFAIEDFVNPELLLIAVNREFKTSGKSILNVDIGDIPKNNKINWLAQKCQESDILLPSKVKIAENISKIPSDENIIDNQNKEILVGIHNKIIQLMKN